MRRLAVYSAFCALFLACLWEWRVCYRVTHYCLHQAGLAPDPFGPEEEKIRQYERQTGEKVPRTFKDGWGDDSGKGR